MKSLIDEKLNKNNYHELDESCNLHHLNLLSKHVYQLDKYAK